MPQIVLHIFKLPMIHRRNIDVWGASVISHKTEDNDFWGISCSPWDSFILLDVFKIGILVAEGGKKWFTDWGYFFC